jgi:hypothetical protein
MIVALERANPDLLAMIQEGTFDPSLDYGYPATSWTPELGRALYHALSAKEGRQQRLVTSRPKQTLLPGRR